MRVVLLAACLGGCVIFPKSLEPPANDQTTVALLTGTLGAPLNDIARHPWFAVRRKGQIGWEVYEVGGGGGTESDPFRKHYPYENPILHKVWRGDEAERAALVEALLYGQITDSRSLWEVADALRIPTRGPYVVIAARLPATFARPWSSATTEFARSSAPTEFGSSQAVAP